MEGETKICPCFQHATEKNGDSDPNEGFLRSLKGRRNLELKVLGTLLCLTATRLRLLPAAQTQKAPKMGKDSEGKVQGRPQKCLKTRTFSSPGTKTQNLRRVWHSPFTASTGKFCCLCALKTSFKRVEMGFSQPLGWDFISTTPERGRTAPKNTSKGFRQSVPPLSLAQFLLGPFRARFSPPKR